MGKEVRVDPSPVLRMGNIISLEDIEEDEDYEALMEDLREGCAKVGTVVAMKVPRMKVKENGEKDAEVPGLCLRPVLLGPGGRAGREELATEDV